MSEMLSAVLVESVEVRLEKDIPELARSVPAETNAGPPWARTVFSVPVNCPPLKLIPEPEDVSKLEEERLNTEDGLPE